MDPFITPLIIMTGAALFRERSVTHRHYQTQTTKQAISEASIRQRIRSEELKYQSESHARQKAVLDSYISLCQGMQQMQQLQLDALTKGFLMCVENGDLEMAESLRGEMREICASAENMLKHTSSFQQLGSTNSYKSLGSG